MYNTRKPYLDDIKRLVRTTWKTKYLSVDQYGVRIKPGAPKGVQWYHTDGIGTKGEDHWVRRTFAYAVKDAFRMNRNDFARDRCIPFGICNHIFLPADDHAAMVEITAHLVDLCRIHDIAIAGGESAIHEGSKGLEISITMFGVRRSFEPNLFCDGDILIGIGSSGAHASGFTRIHSIYGAWEELPDDITNPTFDYYDCIEGISSVVGIHGMTHITGGAFTKMKEYLIGADAYIHRRHILQPHSIFWELKKRGIDDEEMYRTFNCGIGFVISVEKRVVSLCLKIIRQDFHADVIGEVKSGNGNVHIESMFSKQELHY